MLTFGNLCDVGINIRCWLNRNSNFFRGVFALGEEGFWVKKLAMVADVELFEFPDSLHGLMNRFFNFFKHIFIFINARFVPI